MYKLFYNADFELYYWKDNVGNEVDFLLKFKGIVKQLIQVTYASSNIDIKPRETKALLKAANELRCRPTRYNSGLWKRRKNRRKEN